LRGGSEGAKQAQEQEQDDVGIGDGAERACGIHCGCGPPLARAGKDKGLGSTPQTTRTHGPLYSSFIRPSQQDSLLYT
jgi:hypothetical protein